MRIRPLAVATATLAAMASIALGVGAPAQAATADQWGFAYVNNPTVPPGTVLDPAHQAGTWPPGFVATGGKLAPGWFEVTFPMIGAGSKGIVHVTPVNRTGTYCVVVRWFQSGPDEIVDVQCRQPGGLPADTQFTVLWTISSGVIPPNTSHAYVQTISTGAIVQAYNSTGAGVTVSPVPPGRYVVLFSDVATPGQLSGNLQVTAIQPNAQPRRCKVEKWGLSGKADIVAVVACYDQTGTSTDTDFVASYHRERSVLGSFAPPKYFGYVWSPNLAPETNFNYPAGGFGFNGIGALAPPGRYLVKYPLLALNENHAQVTAYGGGSNYCHLTQLWLTSGSTIGVDVLCFDNTGAPAPHDFFSTFTNKD
jgi:hypothetical protein